MKRVLIVNPFGLGDCLFLSPVFRALKEQGKVEKTVLLVGSRTEELFKHHPFVDEVIPIDRDWLRSQNPWKKFQHLRELTGRLKREKFDALIDVSMSREYAFLAQFFLGIPKRVGFDYHRRGIFLTDRLAIPEGYRWKHVMEYYRDLLGPLGIEPKTRKPEIFLSAHEIREAAELLAGRGVKSSEPFAVLVPGGGESWGRDARFKRWPAEHFAGLIRKLEKELPSRHVVILGSLGERPLGETLTANLPGFEVVNWMGERTLRESLSVLSLAACVFTNDGGLCHAARALERPTAAIFGPVDPGVYGPYPVSENNIVMHRKDLPCQPCYRSFRYNSGCQTIECLNEFSPEQAAQKIMESGWLAQINSAVQKGN